MTTIVIVEKSGNVKQVKTKDVTRETLYSKCGFRKADGFEKRTVWKVDMEESYTIEMWSRDDGKANTENKYDFPPPVDTALYFGNCCVVRVDETTDNIVDFTASEWKKIYEKLFGGFEDLVEEEPSEDELENVPKNMKTHSGYLKDGFVVGTDSDSDSSEADNDAACDDDASSVQTNENDNNPEHEDGDGDGDEDGEDEGVGDGDYQSDEDGSELESEKYYYTDDE